MPTNKFNQPHIRVEIVLPITKGQQNPQIQSITIEDLQKVLAALASKQKVHA
jgi:hypothetical protein